MRPERGWGAFLWAWPAAVKKNTQSLKKEEETTVWGLGGGGWCAGLGAGVCGARGAPAGRAAPAAPRPRPPPAVPRRGLAAAVVLSGVLVRCGVARGLLRRLGCLGRGFVGFGVGYLAALRRQEANNNPGGVL